MNEQSSNQSGKLELFFACWLGLQVCVMSVEASGQFASLQRDQVHASDHIVVRLRGEEGARLAVRDPGAVARQLGLPPGADVYETELGRVERLERRGVALAGGRGEGAFGGEVNVRERLYIKVPEGTQAADLVALVEKNAAVEYAELDWIMNSMAAPPVRYYQNAYQFRNRVYTNAPVPADIRAEEAWELTQGSSNVVVAVLDSGIHADLPEFNGRLVSGYDFVHGDADPADDFGHGTEVTSVLAANPTAGSMICGVDWGCRIMAVKVLSSNDVVTTSWMADGIDWAVRHGAKVVNMSFGGFGFSSSAVELAISNGVAQGVIFISSSGNSITNGIAYPAKLAQVIAVGATGMADRKASFSSYGPELDLVAPGVDLPTTGLFGGIHYANGTSFSAPLVTGVASLLCAVRPELSSDLAYAFLCAGADDRVNGGLDTPGFDAYAGWGRLNAFASVRLAQSGASTTNIAELRALFSRTRGTFGPVPERPGGTAVFAGVGHASDATVLAYSADGQYLASGGEDGEIWIWEAGTGRAVRVLRQGWPVLSLAFFPDQRLAAGCLDGRVRIWSIESGALAHEWQAHEEAVAAIALTRDGTNLVTGSFDGRLRVWRADGWEQEREWLAHEGSYTRSVAFTTDGGLLLSAGGDGPIRIWRAGDGGLVHEFLGHTAAVNALSCSEGGDLVASGSDDETIKIWDLGSGSMRLNFVGLGAAVRSVSLSGEGRYVLGGCANGVLAYGDILARTLNTRTTQHQSEIRSVLFAPGDAVYATASLDNTVKISSAADGSLVHALSSQSEAVSAGAIAVGGTFLATGGADKLVKLWRLEDGGFVRDLAGHTKSIRAVQFSRDAEWLCSGARDGKALLWKVADGTLARALNAHEMAVNAAAFSPDNKVLATGGEDRVARTWLMTDGSVVLPRIAHPAAVAAIEFSPDGTLLITGADDRKVRVFRSSNGVLLRVLEGHRGPVQSLAFSPDGRLLLSGSTDHTLKLWRVEDGVELRQFDGMQSMIGSAGFSPDGTAVMASGKGVQDGAIRFWSRATGSSLRALWPTPGPLLFGTVGGKFSPQGDRVYFLGSQGRLGAWQGMLPMLRTSVRAVTAGQVQLRWEHGDAGYQVQRRADLRLRSWENLGEPTRNNEATVIASEAEGFFRVIGTDP